MATTRKWLLLCGIAAFLTVTTVSPVVRADEMRFGDRTVTEGNRGGRGHGGGRGGRYYGGGGSGWAWAGLGAAVGLGILAAVTSDDSPSYTYVQPAPTYVYPQTTYYYPAPVYSTTTYVQPRYVQPNYGQAYVVPAQPMAPPPPCNVCP